VAVAAAAEGGHEIFSAGRVHRGRPIFFVFTTGETQQNQQDPLHGRRVSHKLDFVIEFGRWDLAALAEKWRRGAPFPHVTVDDLVAPDSLTTLSQAISEEPHWPGRGEIYDFMWSAQNLQHPTLQRFQQALAAPAALEAVRAITGKPVGTVEMRSYVYLKGSYLLPHSDCQTRLGRLVAYAFYVYTQSCKGGELELFDVALEDGHPVSTRPAAVIEPRPNRLVLFNVSPATLHQVREILDGARLSLSGWFYA
jgi:hypothetical protein